MKKLLALIFAALMLLSLIACNAETPPDNKNNNNGSSQNQSDNNTDDNGSDSSQNQTDNNTDANDSNSSQNRTDNTGDDSQTDNAENSDETTFSGLVAVDNAECSIKVTEIDPDNFWGYTLKLQLENKSADKTYMFSVESAAIDGIQCDPLFAAEVTAGKKANKEIHFAKSSIEESGIKDYTDIELTFRVYDSDDWLADAVAKETVHVYPHGASKAVKYVRTPQASDHAIVDDQYVTVIVTGYEEDSIWGYTVKLFLVNKTDKDLMFSVSDASVNGYMADPFWAKSISADKCAFTSLSWSNATLDNNGITSIEEIEFTLSAYDEDDWFNKLVNVTVTLTP